MKVFVNAYLENNLGDDLFFDILKARYTGNKFYIMSSSMKKEENVVVYRKKLINRIVRRFELKRFLTNKCDIIVSIGGSMYNRGNINPFFKLLKSSLWSVKYPA